MHRLKDQLRLILPGLAKEANANKDSDVKRRLNLIKAVCASPKPASRVCEQRGESTDTFNFWGERLRRGKSLEALRSSSRAPKRSPRRTCKRTERQIARLRRAEPSHGCERISEDLRRLNKISCPPSTVNAVLRRIGAISKAASAKLTKKHMKRYRRPLPGYGQMDVKYVPFKLNGAQLYEFNFVDHCTTWRLARIYRNFTHACLLQFLAELERECPFPIFQIQTDNGVEFTDKYRGRSEPSDLHPLDLWCAERGIEHRLIPVGQKELNGKVENTHKQDDREFYAGFEPRSFEQLESAMRGWSGRWNSLRRTKALGWKTPDESLEAACVRALAWLAIMLEGNVSLYRIDAEGDATLDVPKPIRARRKTRRKRPTAVDRYLQWIEWDEK